MHKYLIPVTFILCSVVIFFTNSCTYKNQIIPDLEHNIIDTVITESDTSGYIFGKLYKNGAEEGTLFQAYTVDIYSNADTILSISNAYNNQKFLILLSSNSIGSYTAVSLANINDPTIEKKCLIYFDVIANSNSDLLINMDTGDITIESFNSSLNLLRGTMKFRNSIGGTKYEFRGDFAFKIRVTQFPFPI